MSKRVCIKEVSLSAYLDGELSEEASGQIEIHLASCGKCSALYERMKSDGDLLLQSLSVMEPPARMKLQLFKRIDAAPERRPGLLEWMQTGQILPLRSRPWAYACVSMLFLAVVISAFHFQRRMENGRLLAEIDRSRAEWVARGNALNPFNISTDGAPLKFAAGNPFKAYLNER